MFSLKSLFLGLTLLTSHALSTYMTVPLYVDPSNNNWAPLYSAIAANPSLTFNLIINPNSGPGSSAYPDSDTIAGLGQLNTYPNVNTLGYVYVDWCARSESDVQAEVNTYAGWKSYTGGQDIHVDGIFFDEAPADYSSSDVAYMRTVTGYVKSAFPSGANHVAFNPGATADASYFQIADSICIFESTYSQYSANTPSAVPAGQKAASTIIIYDFSGSSDDQQAIVEAVAASDVAGLYITSSGSYQDFSDLWSQFVVSMAATGGSAPVANPPSTPASSSSSSAALPSTSTTTSKVRSSTAAPRPSSAAPPPSSASPEPTPQTTSAAPQPSSAAPESSPYEPEPTPAAPESSSAAPDPASPTGPPTTLTVIPIPASSSTTSDSSSGSATASPTYRHHHWNRPHRHSNNYN
jgi:hypothetical protein